ncbi:MAG: hypothetical protein DMF63_00395 [Acidobacteria bacterium]|nr:MAG: hypothetical protein DMF63_00395 [Acidobacteriota bacterium]
MTENSSFQYRWVTGDGGPLITMESRLLTFWEGSDAPSDGRVVEAEFRWGLDVATDYDKACDVNDLAGVIDINNGTAFVLSTENSMATWLPEFMGFDGAIIEWDYADGESELIEEASILVAEGAFSRSVKYEVSSSPLVLFVAAEGGQESGYKRQTFEVGVGNYTVKSGRRVTDRTSVVCHLFQLQG